MVNHQFRMGDGFSFASEAGAARAASGFEFNGVAVAGSRESAGDEGFRADTRAKGGAEHRGQDRGVRLANVSQSRANPFVGNEIQARRLRKSNSQGLFQGGVKIFLAGLVRDFAEQ